MYVWKSGVKERREWSSKGYRAMVISLCAHLAWHILNCSKKIYSSDQSTRGRKLKEYISWASHISSCSLVKVGINRILSPTLPSGIIWPFQLPYGPKPHGVIFDWNAQMAGGVRTPDVPAWLLCGGHEEGSSLHGTSDCHPRRWHEFEQSWNDMEGDWGPWYGTWYSS